MEMKYKKFVDDGNGDCIYCRERRYDCCCDEKTAISLGYHYDYIPITKILERPPMPKGLTLIEECLFSIKNSTSQKGSTGVWRKGKQWFKSGYDLVDYYNHIDTKS